MLLSNRYCGAPPGWSNHGAASLSMVGNGFKTSYCWYGTVAGSYGKERWAYEASGLDAKLPPSPPYRSIVVPFWRMPGSSGPAAPLFGGHLGLPDSSSHSSPRSDLSWGPEFFGRGAGSVGSSATRVFDDWAAGFAAVSAEAAAAPSPPASGGIGFGVNFVAIRSAPAAASSSTAPAPAPTRDPTFRASPNRSANFANSGSFAANFTAASPTPISMRTSSSTSPAILPASNWPLRLMSTINVWNRFHFAAYSFLIEPTSSPG